MGFLHVDQYPHLVEILVAGDRMSEFETIDESKLVCNLLWLMGKLFKKPLKSPINLKRTKWLTNENFLGSYAFHALSAQEDTVDNLAKPIFSGSGKPTLLFAGEATDKKFMGYVNGAMNSGERAAEEVISFYRNK
jgi:spermine oxidase